MPAFSIGLRVACVATVGLAASALAVQQPAGGRLLDSLVSRHDAHQLVAVYLPPQYDSTRQWPVLIAMDPRGRALKPIQLLQKAADRLGYIIISSYNTRSDELFDPNAAAVNAIIADAPQLFSVDPARLYLAGFSGTARAAWEYCYALAGHVAGVMGFGAGFPPGWRPPPDSGPPGAEPPFVFFGGAGATDFNHEEMEFLGPRLDTLGLHHRIVFYGGPHSWAPADVMEQGVSWLELQAVRRGLALRSTGWVDSVFRDQLFIAASADSAGRLFESYEDYRGIAADFHGLLDLTAIDLQVDRLGATKVVRLAAKNRRERLARYQDRIANLRRVLAGWRSASAPPSSERLARDLKLRELQAESADSSDMERALAAERMLEEIYAVASFYEPRWATGIGVPAHALVLLELADLIHPGRHEVCTRRQDVLGRLGRIDTIAAFGCPN